MALQQHFIDAMQNNHIRKAPIFNTRRSDMDKLTRAEFRDRLRLSTETYTRLHQMLEPEISPKLPHNHAVPSHTRLQSTLRFFAQGSMLQSNADCYGISKASMGSFTNLVTDAIVNKMDEFIKWPENMGATKAAFFDVAGLPNVIGCIDCTHITLTGLHSDIEHAYVNRKGKHSINVQAICDADRIFTNVVARWPGSCHDTHIFNNSGAKVDLEARRFGPGWMLGDSGYPCMPYLLTPFIEHNLTEARQQYNRAHKKTRVIIECAFGDLKSRFRCLNKQGGDLHYEPARACRIITACMCLHNMCKRLGEEDFAVELDLNEQRIGLNADGEAETGRVARDHLVQTLYG